MVSLGLDFPQCWGVPVTEGVVSATASICAEWGETLSSSRNLGGDQCPALLQEVLIGSCRNMSLCHGRQQLDQQPQETLSSPLLVSLRHLV